MRRFDPGYVRAQGGARRRARRRRRCWCTASAAASASAPGATNEFSDHRLGDPRVRRACRGCCGSPDHRGQLARAALRRRGAPGLQDPQLMLLRTADGVLTTRRGLPQRPLRLRHPLRGRRRAAARSALTEPGAGRRPTSSGRAVGRLRRRLAAALRRRLPARAAGLGRRGGWPAPTAARHGAATGSWPRAPSPRPSSPPCTTAAASVAGRGPQPIRACTAPDDARLPDRLPPPARRLGRRPAAALGRARHRAGSPSASSARCSATPASRSSPSARATSAARRTSRPRRRRPRPTAPTRDLVADPRGRRRLRRDAAQPPPSVRAARDRGRQARAGGEADRAERRAGRRDRRSWRPRAACSAWRRCGRSSCRSST